ncbi:GPI ethanolamine phosphate transferase 2, partial [Protobothrops mucrosquamatus]|uniref:GPI ethanolamine phosphate transferase 2 n=1 Tax=Protobothrops mucrosquamatus TaxID=103944 RepID=UPI000775A4C3
MRLRSGVFASFCLLVQALGVGLFLRGFFPVAVRSQLRSGTFGQVPPEPPQTDLTSNWTKISPIFNKVVIVLIDALRDDFVFGSKGLKFMPYTTELVEKGTTHAFIAEAKAPTVTMPRIK